MTEGPRLYNLFPLLAGSLDNWPAHFERAKAMGFDWIYVNPFHYPGFSGSLYAVKDPDRLHPLLESASGGSAEQQLRRMLKAADGLGLKVMLDLVINHVSKDALLVERHPEWMKRESSGELVSPRAVDPLDPRQETVWGDLAALDYDRPELWDAELAHWSDYVARHLAMGFRGFRCDAAYQVPATIWGPLVEAAKSAEPSCRFAAETLGCTPEEVEALGGVGFDWFFNSAKWWDFQADWLLEQYELYRDIAPTIAFPESHDTERLAAELAGRDPATQEKHYRLRYLFAASFSTGIMLPMGYEYGFAQKIDVVRSRPGDWQWEAENKRFDLTGFIAEVNAVKARMPALNEEGRQRRISPPESRVVALLRAAGDDERTAEEGSLFLANPDETSAHGIEVGPLMAAAGGRLDRFEEVTPGNERRPLDPGEPLTLAPLEARLYRLRRAARPASERKGPSARMSEARLKALSEQRIAIEAVYPELDCGRHAVKRTIGDRLEVAADILSDGHDVVAAVLAYRGPADRTWRETPLSLGDNDRWRGGFPLDSIGRWRFTILAWRDLFATWRMDTAKKVAADQDVSLELEEGRLLVERAAAAAQPGADRKRLSDRLASLEAAKQAPGRLLALLFEEELAALMRRAGERINLTRYEREPEVTVDRTTARFGAWYELFPRSMSDDPKRHGTFDDVIAKLPYVRSLGFDVLYFPPIHPIGKTNRKGRNNSLTPAPDDPGSPYAIGSPEGGHDALHPELGDFASFERLLKAAEAHGLEIALDFAIQCSPDHPWLKEHPEWFDWRPDGTIKFAENPPKKYEDIVNVHFYRGAIPSIWYALRDVVLFWVGKGVRIFRVDNPHTKPLPFWEWMLREVTERHPDVIFLSEAFTRPKMMKRLAKIGFTQSYTYFTWRTGKAEFIDYLTELTTTEAREYYRPNFFTNTPDINPRHLQSGKRSAFMARATLAATLAASYGIYSGFELCEGTPIPGKEEYLDSEKYEIKAWDWNRPTNIRNYIARLNRIRQDNPALWDHLSLRFFNAWNDQVLYYGKFTHAKDNAILVAVNLDPDHAQGAHFEVPLWEFGLPDDAAIEAEDLFTGRRFLWHGKVQQLWLDPAINPAAIWRLIPPGSRAA